MTAQTKKILMVLTSHDALGDTGEKTGFWIEEFAAPYYAFIDAGYEITLASPAGGQPPVDPKSELDDFQTDFTRRFAKDVVAQEALASTAYLGYVDPDDFDAVFYPGGHGPLWDLVHNKDSIGLIEAFIDEDKPVATVCHASAVLLNAKDAHGEYLVKGKAVTGFTNSEEAAVELTSVVPFLLEDKLTEHGADFQKVADWYPLAIQDGLIFTGQNPASSKAVAEKLLDYLA